MRDFEAFSAEVHLRGEKIKKEKRKKVRMTVSSLCAAVCVCALSVVLLYSEISPLRRERTEADLLSQDVMELKDASGVFDSEMIADGEAVSENEPSEKFSGNSQDGFWVADATRPSDVPEGMNYSEYLHGTQSVVDGSAGAVGLWCFRYAGRYPAKDGCVQPGMAVTWEIRNPDELETFCDMYALSKTDIENAEKKLYDSFFEKYVLLAIVIEIKENDGFFGLTKQTYDEENAAWNVSLVKTSDDSEGESYPVWILTEAEKYGEERNAVTLTVDEVRLFESSGVEQIYN